MKKGTDRLWKFEFFMIESGLPKYAAKGLLQSIWDGAAENTPDGAIGKFSNEQICMMIGYAGNPDEIIRLLIKYKWLDEHPEHRLVIHDWPDHCENQVHYDLLKCGKNFACGSAPNIKKLSGTQREIIKENKEIKDEGNAFMKFHEVSGKGVKFHASEALTITNTSSSSNTKEKEKMSTFSCPEAEKIPASGPQKEFTLESPPSPEPPNTNAPVFPCRGSVATWTPPVAFIKELSMAYAPLDVDTELRRALIWVNASPERKKTAKGMGRFISSWMSRAVNRQAGQFSSRPVSQPDDNHVNGLAKPMVLNDATPEWTRNRMRELGYTEQQIEEHIRAQFGELQEA